MKIKPENKSKAKKKKSKSSEYHWWLAQDLPRAKGRLSQLAKHNQRKRSTREPSEFITMAKEAEASASPLKSR